MKIKNPKTKIQNPKTEIQNPKTKIQNKNRVTKIPNSKFQMQDLHACRHALILTSGFVISDVFSQLFLHSTYAHD